MHRRSIVAAFRRRVRALEADIGDGTFFIKHPTITASEVFWLANDTQYLGVLRTHEAFETFLNIKSLHHCAEKAAGPAVDAQDAWEEEDDVSSVVLEVKNSSRRLWTNHSSDEDIALAYKAISSLHPTVRNVPRVVEALTLLNALTIERIPSMDAKTAVTIVRQIPTLNIGSSRTIQMAVAMCNHWFPLLHTLSSMNDVRSFLQTVGSQFTRVECAGVLAEVDIASLDTSLVGLLSRRHELRRLAPTVVTTYSKLHTAGMPLGQAFSKALYGYMTHIVRRKHHGGVPISSGEALRVLSAISRVRLAQKSNVFEEESTELLSIAARDIGSLDAPELAMLMSCVAFHYSGGTPASTPSGGGGAASVAAAAPAFRPDKLMHQMRSLVQTMSLRGLLSCCRSAAHLALSHNVVWDDGLCDAVARRCKEMLLNEQEYPERGRNRLYPKGEQPTKRNVIGAVDRNSMLFEKLTVLAAANPFLGKTAYTRKTTQYLVASLVELHPYELTATNISLMFSSIASAFGVPVGTGEIQTTVGRPPIGSAEVRRRSHVHELDPNLLTSLIEKAGMGSKLSQYAYSTLLRNFCRLGLEYSEVAGVVQRILSMRYEGNPHYNVGDQTSKLAQHPRHDMSAQDAADQLTVVASSKDFARSVDLSWEMRSRGLYLMSPHMSEIVFSSLVALKCEHPTILTYVAWGVLLHSGGAVPPHLESAMNDVALMSPLVAMALKHSPEGTVGDAPDVAGVDAPREEETGAAV